MREYEDAYQALDQSIAETGRSKKEIAAAIYPGRRIETALSLFSRAMTPENTDVHLNVEMIETIMERTRADDFLFYLCDKFGFERPARKKSAIESDIRMGLQGMQKQMIEMMRKLEKLEKENRNEKEEG